MIDRTRYPPLPRPGQQGCEKTGCGRKHYAKGLCQLHYNQTQRGSDGRGKRGRKPIDITGERHGMLVAIEKVSDSGYNGGYLWRWACDCGGERISSRGHVARWNTPSCGCYKRTVGQKNIKRAILAQTTHGMSGTPTWEAWREVKLKPNVSPSWKNFETFLEDMGTRPENPQDPYILTLLDPNEAYGPSNCAWLTMEERKRVRWRGCSVKGCDERHSGKGLCRKHYGEKYRVSHPKPKKDRRRDLSGKRFERLMVVRRAEGKDFWECRCDCGQSKIIKGHSLVSSGTRSCGCLAEETRKLIGPKLATHGMSNTPTYSSWQAMKRRCSEPNHRDYPRYGGRGISVCPEWKNSFETFWKDMGTRPDGMTIDRIDNNGNYEPGNCRWATAKEQRANQ